MRATNIEISVYVHAYLHTYTLSVESVHGAYVQEHGPGTRSHDSDALAHLGLVARRRDFKRTSSAQRQPSGNPAMQICAHEQDGAHDRRKRKHIMERLILAKTQHTPAREHIGLWNHLEHTQHLPAAAKRAAKSGLPTAVSLTTFCVKMTKSSVFIWSERTTGCPPPQKEAQYEHLQHECQRHRYEHNCQSTGHLAPAPIPLFCDRSDLKAPSDRVTLQTDPLRTGLPCSCLAGAISDFRDHPSIPKIRPPSKAE